MHIQLIGSDSNGSGKYQYLTTYLVNDTVAIDAGSLGLFGSPQQQAGVKHVLLSHAHMDHIASLPIFLENAFEGGPDCVTIHASEAVQDCLRQHLFNDQIWPDFLRISEKGPPFLRFATLTSGQPLQLNDLTIVPVPLHHPVPTFGFLVADKSAAVVFASDTGPTDEIWARANELPHLKAAFLEVTFPDHMADLARISCHLTAATFAQEVQKVSRAIKLIAIHLKPRFREQIIKEIQALHLPDVEIAMPGKDYRF